MRKLALIFVVLFMVTACTTTTTNDTDPTPTPEDAMEQNGDAMEKVGGDGSGSGQTRDDNLSELDSIRLGHVQAIAEGISDYIADNGRGDNFAELGTCNREKSAIPTDFGLDFIPTEYISEVPVDEAADDSSGYSICLNNRDELVVWSDFADSAKINAVVAE